VHIWIPSITLVIVLVVTNNQYSRFAGDFNRLYSIAGYG
jgi:hypothetical protein